MRFLGVLGAHARFYLERQPDFGEDGNVFVHYSVGVVKLVVCVGGDGRSAFGFRPERRRTLGESITESERLLVRSVVGKTYDETAYAVLFGVPYLDITEARNRGVYLAEEPCEHFVAADIVNE